MRKFATFGIHILLLIAIVSMFGCKTPEQSAYRTLASTSVVVDGAMKAWGDHVRAGNATLHQQVQVRASYERYQAAMKLAQVVVNGYRNTNDKPTLVAALETVTDASSSIIELVELFTGRKLT